MNIKDWIVRSKRGIKPGDVVAVIKAPRTDGIVELPTVGEVKEITKHHVCLEVNGQPWYCYADSVFAVKPPEPGGEPGGE